MMSDIDNLDVMLGSGNENPIERELADAIEQSSVQGDYEANEYQRDIYRVFAQEKESLRQNEVSQSQVNLILGCPKKWIPCCLWSMVR